jgi:SOS response regulatory protein OraA/RecX
MQSTGRNMEEWEINNKQALTKAPISAAAERMRRHRARRRDGLRSLTIELHEREVDALIRSGFLEKSSRNDANAVVQALYRVFNRIFR